MVSRFKKEKDKIIYTISRKKYILFEANLPSDAMDVVIKHLTKLKAINIYFKGKSGLFQGQINMKFLVPIEKMGELRVK